MSDENEDKTRRFVDALDDTLPEQRPVSRQLKARAPQAPKKTEEEAPKEQAAFRRLMHLTAALLALSVLSSEIVAPILGHLNEEAPLTVFQWAFVGVKLSVFGVFLWSWIQFARKDQS